VAFNIHNLGRVKLGTRNIASAKQALANAARYALERRQFGRRIADFGLIRQKLAEMSVRCYVGDAMVYRALGDVDRALQAVDEADGPRVLKTIEGYAVECSVNKVWTSESLAFVVDEALQVFGGNGYSREFPAERAYRDARITRIYEGTNEINRLIIPTRLLKQGAALQQDNAQAADARPDGPLALERGLLARAKRLAIKMLTESSETYGDSLKEQQEVLGHTADVVIEVYAIESALARTEKLAAARGADGVPAAIDSARIYAADAADRITHSAKQVVMALASHGRGGSLTDVLRPIADFAGIDAIAARRRVADAVIETGRHPF
jgi:butyryl-CoA dehydrogenase